MFTLSANTLLDIGAWDEVCEVKGWSPWCINEGSMSSSEQVALSELDLKNCPTVKAYLRRKMEE